MAIQKHRTTTEWDDEPLDIDSRGLTYEEGLAVLDIQARRRLNMSGEEFLAKWRANAFSEEFKDEHHSAFAALSIIVMPFVK